MISTVGFTSIVILLVDRDDDASLVLFYSLIARHRRPLSCRMTAGSERRAHSDDRCSDDRLRMTDWWSSLRNRATE